MQIDPETTLFEITETWPATVPVFVSQGFSQMQDAAKRSAFDKQVSLRQTLRLKNIDLGAFVRRLKEAITGVDDKLARGAGGAPAAGRKINVVGLLPYPVRIPMLEAFEPFIEEYREKTGLEINYELQAASMGAA